MATHAATRNISGLARALAQSGLMSEYEAEALQTQAQAGQCHLCRAGAARQAHDGAAARGVRLARVRHAAARPCELRHSTRSTRTYVDLKIAQARRVLPLHKRSNRLYVAISDPANLQALEEVRFKTNLVPEPVVVEDDKLGQAIAQAGRGDRRHAQGHGQPRGPGDRPRGRRRPQRCRSRTSSEVEDAPVVKYIQKLLIDAIAAGASDIHFEPYEKFYRVRYRLDGILMEIAQPPLAIKDKVASRIKVISQARHLGEARAAGRPDEARAVEDEGDRFPRVDAADALRREDRDAYPRLGRHQARHRGAGLRARSAGGADVRDRAALRDDPRHRARPAAARPSRCTPASTS